VGSYMRFWKIEGSISKQWAKEYFIQFGDENSRSFHAIIN